MANLPNEQCAHAFRPIDSSGQLACVHCNERYRQALVPTETVNDWQPIATAPRDGSSVLLFTKSHGQVEAWFAKGEWVASYESSDPRGEYEGAAWVCADDAFQIEVEEYESSYHDGEATHWRPLHPAPAEGTYEQE